MHIFILAVTLIHRGAETSPVHPTPVEPLHAFSAIASFLVAFGFLFYIKKLGKEGVHRLLRNHLSELSKAWFLLALYYLTRLCLMAAGYPADIGTGQLDTQKPFFSYAYHLWVMFICFLTNLYLLRSTKQLEVKRFMDPRGEMRFRSRSRVKLVVASVLNFLTVQGLWLSFLLALFLLMLPMLVREVSYSQGALTFSYLASLLVSSALFLRLAVAYFRRQFASITVIVTVTYGILQLAYPWLSRGDHAQIFEYVLSFGKFFFAVGVAMWVHKVYSLYGPEDDSRILLKETYRGEQLDLDPLAKAGLDLYDRSRLRIMVQLCSGLLALGGAVLILRVPYARSVAVVSDFDSTLLTLFVRLVWIIPFIFSFQLIGYGIIHFLSHSIDWKAQAAGALQHLLHIDHRLDDVDGNVRCLTLVSKIPDAEEVQVVLLHGIFSSSERCWGLFPALLIASKKAKQVHLLSYKHSLWSRGARLREVEDDLKVSFSSLVAGFAGETVIYAHSLGTLLTVRALLESPMQIYSKVRHVSLLAPPLTGSLYSILAFPWSWPRQLLPFSDFVSKSIKKLFSFFPTPGHVVGEEAGLPSCAFVYGTRDRVAGRAVELFRLPGAAAPVSSLHSVSRVFLKGDHADRLLAEMESPPRTVSMMRLLASNMGGLEGCKGVVFQRAGAAEFEDAVVLDKTVEGWGGVVDVGQHPAIDRKVRLEEHLKAEYEKLGIESGSLDSWEAYWRIVCEEAREALPTRRLACLRWGTERCLVLFQNLYGGFAVIRPK